MTNERDSLRSLRASSERDSLRAALRQAIEAVLHLLEMFDDEDDPGPGIRVDVQRWRTLVGPAGRDCRTPSDIGAAEGEGR